MFKIRDLHATHPDDERAGVHDVIFTGPDGVVRYSDDVYDSAAEATEAMEQFKAGEPPLHWEVLSKDAQ